MKIKDEFSKAEWEALLRDANAAAVSSWEMNFVSDIQSKYEEYGAGMFISDKQLETLERIVSGESHEKEEW